MKKLTGRLRREHKTLVCMTRIYCAHHHRPADGDLCADCTELMAYAEKRLQKCPYGNDKPTCANCPIHCYKPLQRQQAREVMRFAGPRMPWRHPLRAITHLYDKIRPAPHPLELRRMKRQRSGASSRTPEA